MAINCSMMLSEIFKCITIFLHSETYANRVQLQDICIIRPYTGHKTVFSLISHSN